MLQIGIAGTVVFWMLFGIAVFTVEKEQSYHAYGTDGPALCNVDRYIRMGGFCKLRLDHTATMPEEVS